MKMHGPKERSDGFDRAPETVDERIRYGELV